MRRTTLGPVSQSGLNMRSSIGSAARLPRSSLAFKPSNDRRASAFPSLGGRRSTAQNGRASVAYNSRGVRQDPRPLGDRSYMAATIRKLIAFLIERGYDQPLSMKILSNPSSRDFQNIFIFLLHRHDPTFEFAMRRDRKHQLQPVRFDDELPALLRCLAYPFSVSKSVLSAVGSPHAWPQLLGVLSWLMGLLQYEERFQTQRQSHVAEPAARRTNLFMKNTVDAYAHFLQGADTHPDLDKALEDHFIDENQNRAEEINKLESDRDQLAQTLHGFRTHASPLQLVNEHKTSLETNIRKFKLLIPSLLEHAASVRKKLVERDTEIEREDAELAEMIAEKATLVDVLARQDEFAIDAERIAAERDTLREGLHKVGEERTVADEELKRREQLVATHTATLDDATKVYHRNIAKLGLSFDAQPGDELGTVSASDCSLAVSPDDTLTDARGILSRNVQAEVLPRIHELKEAFAQQIPAKQEAALRLQEQVDEVEEQLIMLRHDLSLVEARRNKLEAEYRAEKEGLTRQLQLRSEAIMKKEGDISHTRERLREAAREKDRQIAELYEQRDVYADQFSRERHRVATLIGRNVDAFGAHQAEVRRCIGMVKEHFDEESARLGVGES